MKFQLFQILKDDAVEVLHWIWQQIWKAQQWPQDWKRSVFIPTLKKSNAKEWSNYHRIVLISDTSKLVPQILQTRLQQYMNRKIPDVQAGFRKGRGTRDQTANILWIIKTVRVPEKHLLWALESITTNKASGDDGIPVELFQILKGDAVKLLQSISQKIWKTQQWPQDWKR